LASQWFVYKNQERRGPYSWAQLYQEARSGRLTAGDLVWNETMKDWDRAENIPGLIKKPGTPSAAPPPPAGQKQAKPQAKPASHPPKSRGASDYKKLAIAGSAVFLFVISGVFAYLFLTGDDPRETAGEIEEPSVEEDTEDEFDFDEMFGDLAEDEEEPLPDEEEGDTETAEQETQQAEESVEESTTETTQEDAAPVEDAEEADDETEPESHSIAFEGGTYTGPLKNGQPHGYGSWVHSDGRSYTGEFNEGNIEGYGTYTFPGGEKYVGYLKNGRAHGEGTMTHPDGREVSGTWIHGNLQED